MSDSRPGHVDEIAAELALGVVDGEERARALEHLAGCPECRRTVEELSEVADGLLLLAPSREVPIGFESRALEPLRARPSRSGKRRALVPIAAAATAAALAVTGTLLVVEDDLQLASDYRGTLAEANGEGFQVAHLYGAGEGPVGTVFGYQGSPSWLLVIVDPPERTAIRSAELVMGDGGRVPLRPFALDPTNGSWGGAIPVALDDVSVVRLLPAEGEPLVARPRE
jgi:putative zinc finger protein